MKPRIDIVRNIFGYVLSYDGQIEDDAVEYATYSEAAEAAEIEKQEYEEWEQSSRSSLIRKMRPKNSEFQET